MNSDAKTVDKLIDVKERLLDIIHDEDYDYFIIARLDIAINYILDIKIYVEKRNANQ